MSEWVGPDGLVRCAWTGGAPEFLAYHDDEWGQPTADDQRLFEKLSLEGFQSGLSWRTILNKRPAFRMAFADFDIEQVARFGSRDVERLLGDAGIVRHRGKIEAVVNNAQRAIDLIDAEGSLAAYVWRYEPDAIELGATVAHDVRILHCDVEEPEEAGMEVRRPDDDVRVHAVHGSGQRPLRRLHHPASGRCRPGGVRPTQCHRQSLRTRLLRRLTFTQRQRLTSSS